MTSRNTDGTQPANAENAVTATATPDTATATANVPTTLIGPALDRLPQALLFARIYPFLDIESHFCLAATSRSTHGGFEAAIRRDATVARADGTSGAGRSARTGTSVAVLSTDPRSWYAKTDPGVTLYITDTARSLQRLRSIARNVPAGVVRRVSSFRSNKETLNTALPIVATMAGVTELVLCGCAVEDRHSAYLQSMTQLQRLDLTGSDNITDGGLQYLCGMTDMKTLSLVRCSRISDTVLAHLRDMTQMRELHLFWCSKITDAGLACLLGMTQLQTLGLSRNYNITDAGLACLGGMTQLQKLSLYDCQRISDVGLTYLRSLSQLRELNLDGCYRVSETGKAQLVQALPRLQLL